MKISKNLDPSMDTNTETETKMNSVVGLQGCTTVQQTILRPHSPRRVWRAKWRTRGTESSTGTCCTCLHLRSRDRIPQKTRHKLNFFILPTVLMISSCPKLKSNLNEENSKSQEEQIRQSYDKRRLRHGILEIET